MSPTRLERLWKQTGLFLGPLACAALLLVPSALHRLEGFGSRPAFAAGVAAWMAIWWFSEAVPMWATSLLPLVLYPPLGVFEGNFSQNLAQSFEPFFDAYIFLFLGGMLIGAGMEHSGLHRRLALNIMKTVGTDPRRLLLGVLLSTAAVSMWISNTATAVMMVPIGMALLAQLGPQAPRDGLWRYGTVLMLAVAYGANVGGMATKIGTATNSIFAGYVTGTLRLDLGFLTYMAIGLPFVVLFLPCVWWLLWKVGGIDAPVASVGKAVLEKELLAQGPMGAGERKVAFVFGTAAALWIFQDLLRPWVMPWLSPVLERGTGKHYEAGVAMGAALALWLWGGLPKAAFRRVPWSTLLLLGGSFAMASGMEKSGLSALLAQSLQTLAQWPRAGQLLLSSFGTIGLSAIASNSATINLMLHMLPQSMTVLSVSALAASCDFALPAGTPPNAIVFGSGYVRLPTMMRVGLVLDVMAALLLTAYGLGYLSLLLE